MQIAELIEARIEVAAVSFSISLLRQYRCPLCLLGGRIQETGTSSEALLKGGTPRLQKRAVGSHQQVETLGLSLPAGAGSKERTDCVLSNQKRKVHTQSEGEICSRIQNKQVNSDPVVACVLC